MSGTSTLYAIWLKRPRRASDRQCPAMWGWVAAKDLPEGHGRVPHWTSERPTASVHGFMTYDEAERAAFALAARWPWMIGYLEIRLLYGYRDHQNVFVTTSTSRRSVYVP